MSGKSNLAYIVAAGFRGDAELKFLLKADQRVVDPELATRRHPGSGLLVKLLGVFDAILEQITTFTTLENIFDALVKRTLVAGNTVNVDKRALSDWISRRDGLLVVVDALDDDAGKEERDGHACVAEKKSSHLHRAVEPSLLLVEMDKYEIDSTLKTGMSPLLSSRRAGERNRKSERRRDL
jgi:hypothetical protein